MEKLKKSFLSVNQSVGKYSICNKDIRANDASSLTDDGWKTLTNLAKTWSSVILPTDHQYYEYTQVHELISDIKTTFCKQHGSGHCRLAFGGHPLINKLKKDNEADKSGTEAAAASTSFPSDASVLSARSSTTRTCSTTGNIKQCEQICFVCNEIRPCDSSAYNGCELGVCEFKSVGNQLMDAANAIGDTNTVDLLTENIKIKI